MCRLKIKPQARETRKCAALVAEATRRAVRRKGRCGVAALDYGDVRVAGDLVAIPLCQAHFRMLRDSPDPRELTRTWAFDLPPSIDIGGLTPPVVVR